MKNMIFKGITVLELNGLAPTQFCGQILSDFGATVIRLDKIEALNPQEELNSNGKLSVAINLKSQKGVDVLKRLSSKADVLLEPYRAGVMEKLGLGPDVLLKQNKRLIYTRLSGFGQTGHYSKYAGHDINFLSLSGVLALLGQKNEPPEPPCNIVGDFGGGSLLCALGIAMALFEREKTGNGQVIDVSILRGCSYIASWIFGAKNLLWTEPRGNNILDGGSYMYKVYKTKDGKWMAVGALEKKFYDQLLIGLNLSSDECPYFCDSGYQIFKDKFLEKTQAEWIEIFKTLDACVTPVLTVEEAAMERPEDYVHSYFNGNPVSRPEPKFSISESTPSHTLPPPFHGQHTVSVLKEFGFASNEIQDLNQESVIYVREAAKL